MAIRFISAVVCLLGAALTAAQGDPSASSVTNAAPLREFLDGYCTKCHDRENAKGGISFSDFASAGDVYRDPHLWEKTRRKVRDREMPPPDKKPQPKAEEREAATAWMKSTLDGLDYSVVRDPGRTVIRRLSATEYNNTVHDLLGVDLKPADNFPSDGGGGGGFDNNADTLFVPPILLERYLEAADAVLERAVEGDLFVSPPSRWLFQRSAALKNLRTFASRAFRRPMTSKDVVPFMTVYDRARAGGSDGETAMKLAYKAVLVSPRFLFRVEGDATPSKGGPSGPVSGAGTVAATRLNDYELASRLSYFLWSSMPDEELIRCAARGELHQSTVLQKQVRRMLRDPKAKALAENFAGQWLGIRSLKSTVKPDPKRFPQFTASLRDSMFDEAIELFASVVRDDASVIRLLDANYTFLNEELAKHYEIEGVQGAALRRVVLPDERRGGLLGLGAVLTLTSYPQRTSPVLRGKWILEEVLGSPSPPPPPDAGGLPADDAPSKGKSFRARLEEHRKKPQCASCHNQMDPLGFGLENFDAIGRWRTKQGDLPIDAEGVMASGEKFEGPAGLRRILLARKEEFLRAFSEKLLAYALGRGLEYYDIPAVKKILQDAEVAEFRMTSVLEAVVNSYPFQYRRLESKAAASGVR